MVPFQRSFPRQRLIAASLFLPLLTAAAIGAGSPAVPAEHTAPEGLWEFLDRNGDGRVEPYEGAEAFLFLARDADTDEDGGLTREEAQSFLDEAAAEDEAERTEAFDELDANDDGRLVPEELPDELRDFLGGADQDGDGAITLRELLAANLDDPRALLEAEMLGFLAEVDEDGDGAFALVDLPLIERITFQDDFEELDANSDGLVTREELVARIEEELRGATFRVVGDRAVMTGTIGPSTPARVLELICEHPRVRTIVLEDVPGSMDDHSNLRAARYVRRHGFHTIVPAGGMVASGGTDFFLAGATRAVGSGARLGVHSWNSPTGAGNELPEDDPEHELFLSYYEEMGIPLEFYWYTLHAAPAEDIHWMTQEEIERYGCVTGEPSEAPR